jgi:sigma-B regulation protein RsbU (phosphoserine phosphatase)
MGEGRPATIRRPWDTAGDLLALFTDGISDARNRAGERLGEQKILDVIREKRGDALERIVDAVFEMLNRYAGTAPRRDDLTLVLLRS